MRIIACCKAAPEEQDIVIRDNRELSFDKANWKFGAYDLNAVEAARQLADATDGTVSGLTLGGAALESAKLRKDILSRGLDDLTLISEGGLEELDTYQTALLLKAAIQQMGDYDLVLCGAGSSDQYTQQTGNQLGALLNIPTINAVNRITVGEGNTIQVERLLEHEVQILEMSLPAVLSLTSGINTPRIAGMKDILAAGKKPADSKTPAQAGMTENTPSSEVVSVLAPKQAQRQQTILEGDVREQVTRLLELVGSELR